MLRAEHVAAQADHRHLSADRLRHIRIPIGNMHVETACRVELFESGPVFDKHLRSVCAQHPHFAVFTMDRAAYRIVDGKIERIRLIFTEQDPVRHPGPYPVCYIEVGVFRIAEPEIDLPCPFGDFALQNAERIFDIPIGNGRFRR